jgi:hypothetical protein
MCCSKGNVPACFGFQLLSQFHKLLEESLFMFLSVEPLSVLKYRISTMQVCCRVARCPIHMELIYISKVAVICVVVPFGLMDLYQCFRGACCLHHKGDDLPLWNNGKLLPDCTVQEPRRQPLSYSPLWESAILTHTWLPCLILRERH